MAKDYRKSLISWVTVILTVALVSGCGAVPLTGRKQVLLVSDSEVYQAGLTQYKEYIASSTCRRKI